MHHLIRDSILALVGSLICLFGLPGAVYSQDEQKARVLLPVRVNGLWGYIDPGGVIIIKPRFAVAGEFSEGLAAVRDDEGWFYYINGNGKVATGSKRYRLAEEFSEGLAVVQGERSDDKVGWIDRAGKLAISVIRRIIPSRSVYETSNTRLWFDCPIII